MDALTDRVRQALASAGALRSSQLQEQLGVSQASVSRALAPLLTAGVVLKVGSGRSQAYVMPRTTAGASPLVPVMHIGADGQVAPFGTLVPVVGGRYWMDEDGGPAALHDGLPWFISDMRPQGFLGRAFAQKQSQLQLAAHPDHWNNDDVLRALMHAGEDLPGNLIVGAASFDRHLALPAPEPSHLDDYPALADAAMRGSLPGSSAGGEQPKFCTVRLDGRHVIVKFSPAGDSPADQRWRDLHVAEHLALTTLREGGWPAAASAIHFGGGRAFLEVERFDRTTHGRIGMVSLLAYDAEYVGQMDGWAATALRMAARNLLPAEDAQRLVFFEAFGRLIGNSDRHYGNISLLVENKAWALAPAYDQVPMVYAPVNGELVERDFDPAALAPTADTLRQWPQARELAHAYWRSVAAHESISQEFRSIAARHADRLDEPAGARPASRQRM